METNSAFSGLSGLERDKLIGKDSRDIAPLRFIYGTISECIYDKIERSEQITFGTQILNATITPILVNDNLNLLSIVFRDISAFIQLERALLKRNKELGIINTLSGAFISSGNINSVFVDLLEKVLIVTDFSIGWLVLKEDGRFVLKSVSGASLGIRHELEKGSLDFIYENVVSSSDPLYVLELEEIEKIEVLKREGIVFFSCVPLRTGVETMGILVIANRVEVKFDFDLAAIFSLIGNNISLIAEKIRLFQEAERLAITDGLTGLYNIRFFYDELNKEMARSKRYNTLFSLILFDIDNFKALNDTYGHQAGDEALRSIALVLKSESRQTDIVARYGGEEFILLLPNTPRHEAFSLAERLREKIENKSYLEEKVKINISGGIAAFPEDAGDSKSLLYAADMAMYEAKARGKKQICYFRRKNETGV